MVKFLFPLRLRSMLKQQNIKRKEKEYVLNKVQFNYDKQHDLVYASKEGTKVAGNVMIGEFHVEFDENKKVVGLEILHASELVEAYGISQKILEEVKRADIRVKITNNSLLVSLVLYSLEEQHTATIAMNNIEEASIRTLVSV